MRTELKKIELMQKTEGGRTSSSNRHCLYVAREPELPLCDDPTLERKSKKT